MPSTQDLIVSTTKDSLRQLFVNARAIPEDKRSWRPMGETRDVLDIVKECVVLPVRIVGGLTKAAESQETAAALTGRVTDLEAAEAVGHEACAALGEYVSGLSDGELDETVTLMPGWEMLRADALMIPMRNAQYHVGQLAYIQLMLGDAEDHWM